VKGKSEDDCNNYIRVLAKTETNQLLVCGTNSYNPRSDETPWSSNIPYRIPT
jgi:hypothetical protein